MEMIMNNDSNPESYMECFIAPKRNDKNISGLDVKKHTFKAMKKLEGWCTEHKAEVLIDLILMTKPEVVVEIGVWGGKSLVPMAYALKEIGAGKIYGIDPWDSAESIKGMEGVNKNWWGSVDHNLILQGLKSSIQEFDLEDHIELFKTSSKEASPIYNIGLLHIDGNHSEEASFDDVTKWVPLVKKGGVIVFDDLNWASTSKAVQWLNENCIKLVDFSEDCIWGIWVKP